MELDATWKSYLYALPKGTMKFIINSCINTLPTRANLRLWGRSSSDKCILCGRKETTNHILSSCPASLQQGRYTYRHNNVLKEITENIDTNIFTYYSDIQGKTIGGGTIPPDILVTAEKPDIVIIDPRTASPSNKPDIVIIELTCPWEERLDQAREHKTNKYSSLIKDIEETGHKVQSIPLEIGVRGIVNHQNKDSIKQIHSFTKQLQSQKKFTEKLSRQAVIASYFIFLNRNEKDWNSNVY